jgi:hypothetical protein
LKRPGRSKRPVRFLKNRRINRMKKLSILAVILGIILVASSALAFTVTVSSESRVGRQSVRVGTLAFDSSYPTGGEALTAANLDLSTILFIIIEPNTGYVFQYDYTNSKVIAYWVDTTTDGAPMAQVVDTTNMSAVTAAKFYAVGY